VASSLDDTLVRAACAIADSIGRTFGPNCEVAVHDLRDPTRSLVRLVNGHVTGRQLGSPIRDLIYRVLPHMDVQEGGLFNYLTQLEDGRQLKSSTVLLRNDCDEPVVAFCVNLDITALTAASSALLDLTRLEQPGNGQGPSMPGRQLTDENHVGEILRYLVVNTARPAGRSPDELSKRERLEVIDFLERKGAFQVKGAIKLVAQELGVSEPSVYRYIDEVRRRSAGDSSNTSPVTSTAELEVGDVRPD
jgi:predicted transcriptional regulator YheO